MAALNFQKQFAEEVEIGRKRQTIRAPRKDDRPHCRVGGPLTLYTGMRTKACRKLGDAVCTARKHVFMDGCRLFVDGESIRDDDEFARRDGFENASAMYEWFGKTHGLPFVGTLIEWEPA